MGRRANDSGVRAPDTGSKKRFDTNRQQKDKTGKFNYLSTKRERAQIKAGKNDLLPEVSCTFCISVVVLIAAILSFFVWFMAQLEDADATEE